MDANTTVTGDSHFRHLANALKKRGFIHAAAYIVGLAHGLRVTAASVTTARECWAMAVDTEAMREILEFLQGCVDVFPESAEKAHYVAEWRGDAVAIRDACPDPFAACEAAVLREIKLSTADLAAIYDLVGSGSNLGLFNRLRAAMHATEVK